MSYPPLPIRSPTLCSIPQPSVHTPPFTPRSCNIHIPPAQVHLGEYPVFFGALTATITELYEPFRLNDNLSIPVTAVPFDSA